MGGNPSSSSGLEGDLPSLASLQQPDGSWLMSRRLEQHIPEVLVPLEAVPDVDIQKLARLASSLDEQLWITLLVVAFLELYGDRTPYSQEVSRAHQRGLAWLRETLEQIGQSLNTWLDPTKLWLKLSRDGR